MKATTPRITDRPRSLVTHLIRLTGASPGEARLFANSSGRAAIKRLGIKPAVKTRTKTTVTGRHTLAALTDKTTGESTVKHVRRKKGVPVHRWTLDQAALILIDMKPRKAEYKQMQADAFDALGSIKRAAAPLRRLPRHRKRSRRNR